MTTEPTTQNKASKFLRKRQAAGPAGPTKNKILLGVLLAIIAIVAIVLLVKPNHSVPKLPPEQLVRAALDSLINQESLRFSSESKLIINDNTTIYGRVEGERASANRFHAKGKILGSDLDIYQIDSTTYRRDPLTAEWLMIQDNAVLDDSMLMNELDPTTNFKLLSISNPQVAEDEFAEEEKCDKLVFTPETQNPYFNQFFQDLTYTLWITKDDQQIRKAAISGSMKSNNVEGTLVMDMEFWDWGQPIDIQPPVVE